MRSIQLHTFSVIVDGDNSGVLFYFNLDAVHGRISLLVVCSVDQNLVEDLVEAGGEGDLLERHPALLLVNPHGLLRGLHRADVGVRPEQDVLQLGLLLVDPLHGEPLLTTATVPVHGGTKLYPDIKLLKFFLAITILFILYLVLDALKTNLLNTVKLIMLEVVLRMYHHFLLSSN